MEKVENFRKQMIMNEQFQLTWRKIDIYLR